MNKKVNYVKLTAGLSLIFTLALTIVPLQKSPITTPNEASLKENSAKMIAYKPPRINMILVPNKRS